VAMPADPARFQDKDRHEEGIRYYESSLFLLVYEDGAGKLKYDFRYLPDPSKPMAIRTHSWIAKLETEYTFENGVLTKSIAKVDETAVPKAIVAAAKDLIPASLVKTESSDAPSGVLLYKVRTDGGQIRFDAAGATSAEGVAPTEEGQ